jgi:hypothetical protein
MQTPFVTTGMLAVAVAVMALVITRSKIALPLREWATRTSKWLGKLLTCPFCTSHWLAFGLVAVYRPRLVHSDIYVLDLFMTALVIVAIASIIAGWVFQSIAGMHISDE